MSAEPLPFDKNTLPEWVCWIAQDCSGAWWGYEAEPNQAHDGWYENEVGQIVKIMDGQVNPAWQETLFHIR